MPGTDERKRHELYLAFEDLLGPDKTDTLMGLLPPPGIELATRQDLALARAELRADMADLRREFEGLRGEFNELRSELKTEMADLRAEVATSMREQTRTLLLGMVGSMASMATLVIGAIAITALAPGSRRHRQVRHPDGRGETRQCPQRDHLYLRLRTSETVARPVRLVELGRLGHGQLVALACVAAVDERFDLGAGSDQDGRLGTQLLQCVVKPAVIVRRRP
jgi:hypothetical protein